MLKEAGLFLNADTGSDSESFREACDKENIIPNVRSNSRNSENNASESARIGTSIFDELLCKGRTVIEHANAGRTASH